MATKQLISRSPKTAQVALSPAEQFQLGSTRLRVDGTPSSHPWPSTNQWPRIRAHLLTRSLKANPLLDPTLTAYTPGETLDLLKHPVVSNWHRNVASPLDLRFNRVVFVPCAKTKPWEGAKVSRSRLYSAYNTLRTEFPTTCFVTISEPLGIVTQQDWGNFPQYDNPGLFTDDAQRSGMTTSEWLDSPFRRCYGLPFDPIARERCLTRLGKVIANFIAKNSDRDFISFVDSLAGPPSTHGLMLDTALAQLSTTGQKVTCTRYPKRAAPRSSPLNWMRELLAP